MIIYKQKLDNKQPQWTSLVLPLAHVILYGDHYPKGSILTLTIGNTWSKEGRMVTYSCQCKNIAPIFILLISLSQKPHNVQELVTLAAISSVFYEG
jgi:hypothetical protein